MKKISSVFFIGIIALLFPMVLNYLLALETPFNFSIIENESAGAPATWLAFWGSYIAACASFCMAMVSHKQNKEIRRQNNARIKYEIALKQYEELEKFVLYAEKIYSVDAFENMIVRAPYSPENIDSVSVKAFYEYTVELNKSSLLSIKLFDDEKSDEKEEYYELLSKLYSQAIILSETLQNINNISYNSDFYTFVREKSHTNIGNDFDKFIEYADYKLEELGIANLHKLGFKILRSKWNNVLEKLNNTK